MAAETAASALVDEATYSRTVFEAILHGLGLNDPFRENALLTDRGVVIKDPGSAHGLEWHPLCELVAPGSPNPLDEPWLPFPFTARQLAALMVDGWGFFIQQKFGDWEIGPNPDELNSIGLLGGKAREALAVAYAAFREALELAPKLDKTLADKAQDLVDRHCEARDAALLRERLREPGISDDERNARLARVEESVQELHLQMVTAREIANDAESSWRRSVVQHLLLPIDKVPASAFADPMLRDLPPERRAQELHQQREHLEFTNSAEGDAHWALVIEHLRLERELRRWQLMHPQTVAEVIQHEAKLKELEGRLADADHRLNHWTWAPQVPSGAEPESTDSPSTTTLEHESAEVRQRRRLQDLRGFHGHWVCRNGKWGAKDRTSGAFNRLVSQESANGSKNASPKSVRADLTAAAKAEADEKRMGGLVTGLR